jgi:hypothetical protein
MTLDPEIVRTKGRLYAELERDKTPIIEACQKVQLSTKIKLEDGGYDYKTETVDMPCKRINGDYCSACAFPSKKWIQGRCNVASHLVIETKKGEPHQFITPITMVVEKVEENKRFLNPIKRSKRGR